MNTKQLGVSLNALSTAVQKRVAVQEKQDLIDYSLLSEHEQIIFRLAQSRALTMMNKVFDDYMEGLQT